MVTEWGSYLSSSPNETKRFGALLAAALPPRAVVALAGELGVGKTALVQGSVEGLGARVAYGEDDDGAVSPTFVLVREYVGAGDRRIVHVDAHRLGSAVELADLGSDDFIGVAHLSFVEWADRVADALPRPYLRLDLSHVGESSRRIDVSGVGEGAAPLVEAAYRALAQSGCVVERS